MWQYYIWLSWLSVKKTPVLSSLMVLAIAVGIATCLTTMTLFSVISSNPLAHKNDTTFAIQLDSWDKNEEYWDANGIPEQLTFQDAKALYQSDIAENLALSSRVGLTLEDANTIHPSRVEDGRLATRDFFTLFDIPFKYGGPWDEKTDRAGLQQVVLSENINQYFFEGKNSVGKSVIIEGESYTVAGVVDSQWHMTPSLFDLNMDAFKWPAQIYIPFFNIERKPFPSWGNVSNWDNNDVNTHSGFLVSESVWVQVWASLDSVNQRNQFEQFLRNYMLDERQKGRFQRPIKYRLNTPQEWLEINKVVSRDNLILVYLSAAFLCVCLVNAVVLLLAKFLRKAPEAGLRRALGASRSSLFIQHIAEAMVIGCLGGFLGLLLSWFGLTGVRLLYAHYHNVAIMTHFTLLSALAFAIICSLLSGIIPAWHVARSQPARHLKTQ